MKRFFTGNPRVIIRRLASLLCFGFGILLVYITILPSKVHHYESREIKIENHKYGMYNKDENSFISKDSKNIMEIYENNRGHREDLAAQYNILQKLQEKENDITRKLKTLGRLSESKRLTRLTDTDENSRVVKTKKKTEDEVNKHAIKKLMKTIKNLSEKVDFVIENLQKSNRRRDERARVTNIEDQKMCGNPKVLFLVTSHSTNFERRQTVRANWGNKYRFDVFRKKYNFSYEVFFSVGLGKDHEAIEKTRDESKKYRDMLIINREEDFYDLTRRVMASFQWVVSHCKFTYLFKVDDDIFINIPNVFAFIANSTIAQNQHRLYAGDMNLEAAVNRNTSSKYMVKYDEWPVETYPPYCSGGGFIISYDIIKAIIPLFDWANPYKIDDVYIGILIQRAKIEKVMYYEPVDRYEFWFYGNSKQCHFMRVNMVYHKVDTRSCMDLLTMKSVFHIPTAIKKIEYFRHRRPKLSELPRANVPKGRRYVEPVRSIVDLQQQKTQQAVFL